MTTIVCNDRIMVADTLACGEVKMHVSKIHRLPDGSLIAGAGGFWKVQQAVAYVAKEETQWPMFTLDASAKADETSPALLHLRPEGIYVWEGPYPFKIRDAYHAIGSGAPAALGVYKDAVRRGRKLPKPEDMVLAASGVDPYTNAIIDVVSL